jgi:hypothetical protein
MTIANFAEALADKKRFAELDGKAVLIVRPSREAVSVLGSFLRSNPVYSCCHVRVFGEKAIELEPIDWGRCSSSPGLI